LEVDYAGTFLGAGKAHGGSAFPYESVYTSKKRLMMQDAYEEVGKIYEDKGMNSVFPADHIGIELEFMSYLCKEGAEHLDSNDVKGYLKSIEEQEDFLKKHLLNWVPGFFSDVKKYSETIFYKRMVDFLEDFLKVDKDLLEKIRNTEEVFS
jgi:anaerobic sulfite reductase subunit A